jgi:hypothetical protein
MPHRWGQQGWIQLADDAGAPVGEIRVTLTWDSMSGAADFEGLDRELHLATRRDVLAAQPAAEVARRIPSCTHQRARPTDTLT